MPKLIKENLAFNILTLRNENKTIKEIANLLQLTYSQVVYLINKYHIPKKYFWLTAIEKEFIKNNASLGNATLAKILNRNKSVISRYTSRTFFTDQEKLFIQNNLHLTTYRLAKILNRSYNQTNKIKKELEKHGCIYPHILN